MMLFLSLGVFILSAWVAVRSIGGLVDDQTGDAGRAARNRVERHRGLRLAEMLSRKADLLAAKTAGSEPDTDSTDAELATVDERIAEIEAEYAPMLARETRCEERIRASVRIADLVFALFGVAGVLVAVGGFITLLV